MPNFITKYIENKQLQKSGHTLIELASRGDLWSVNRLLAFPGIRLNQKDDDGRTALILAVWMGHNDVVKALLAAPNILVNEQDKNGYSALMIAAWKGNAKILNLLLSADGIEINQVDKNGFTALMIATWGDHPYIVHLLVADPRIIVNQPRISTRTAALAMAASRGYTQIVETLLKVCSIDDIFQKNIYGDTALTVADRNKHDKIVSLLNKNIELQVREVRHCLAQNLNLSEKDWGPVDVIFSYLYKGEEFLSLFNKLRVSQPSNKIPASLPPSIEKTAKKSSSGNP